MQQPPPPAYAPPAGGAAPAQAQPGMMPQQPGMMPQQPGGMMPQQPGMMMQPNMMMQQQQQAMQQQMMQQQMMQQQQLWQQQQAMIRAAQQQQQQGAYLLAQQRPMGHWYCNYYNGLQQQELQQFMAWFSALDRDRGGSLSVRELQSIQFGGKNLSSRTASVLMSTFDVDKNGELGFWEYVAMHKLIISLQQAFVASDVDRNGRLDHREIHSALGRAGFNLPMPVVQGLFARFDAAKQNVLTFEGFLGIGAHLAHLKSIFEHNDKARSGQVTLDYAALVQITMAVFPDS